MIGTKTPDYSPEQIHDQLNVISTLDNDDLRRVLSEPIS